VADATDLANGLLARSASPSVIIFSADHFILPFCQITNRHNNAMACKAICDSTAHILSTHPDTTLSICWLPGKISFHLLERLQNIAVEAASHTTPDLNLSNPTPTALQITANQVALKEWELV
jgi:hypothetical protein